MSPLYREPRPNLLGVVVLSALVVPPAMVFAFLIGPFVWMAQAWRMFMEPPLRVEVVIHD